MNLIRGVAAAALCLAALVPGQAAAQTCAVAPLNLSGVVNTYWAGTGTLASGSTSVTLGAMRTGTDAITGLAANTTGFAVGDLMLIVQMQDADINDTNGTAYGSGGTSMSGYTNLNSTGLFHYARVTNVGASITFSPATTATFRTAAAVAGLNGQRRYQIIRVPFSRTVNVQGTLRPMSWNGTTGGIVAAEAGQTMTLNAGVDASGLGFRGGGGHRGNNLPAGNPGADTGTVAGSTYTGALPAASTVGNEAGRAAKGEGIAGTPRLLDTRESAALTYGYTTFDSGAEGYPLAAGTGDFGRGAPGNAGGGGNRHDSGGGGGGNSGSGGKGGGAYSTGADFGGFGGSAITGYTGTRLFLGGGGGSGQGFHNPPTTGNIPILSGGGRGGGIAILRADTITGSATIDVRGQSGFGMPTALGGCNLPLDITNLRGLGGEGAGAGGTAYLVAVNSGLGSVIVDARGGNGGNAGHCDTNVAGPGGGGGGGLVVYYTTGTAPVSSVAGGLPGSIATTNVAPGALPGGSQPGSGTGGSLPTEPSPPLAPCSSPDLTIAKTIANNIVAGQTGATYSLVVTNSGAGPKTAGNTVTVTDTLPAGLTATALSGTGWTCVLGTLTCTRTDALNAGSSYPAITLTFSAANSVAGNTTGILNNTASVALSVQAESDATNNNATTPTYVTNVFKSVRVTTDADASGLANPTVGDTLTWSVWVSNPAGAAAVTNFQVNDALPSGVTITATGAHTITDVNGTCGAAPAKNTGYTGAGANGLIAGAQTLPANCVLRIDIPTVVNFGGAKSNQATLSGTGIANVNSDAIDLTTSGTTLPTGVAALANSLPQTQAAGTRDPTIATVSYPAPTITKTFAPAGIAPGNTSLLTITINNTGAAVLTSAALTDNYPAGLVNATSPNGTSSCGGTVTAVSGTSSVALSGASVPAAGVCTITVNVTITGSGTYLNTIPIGALTNAQGASNTVAASATLYTNPTVAKSFSPTAVAPNADSTLSIAITNPNTAALTLSNPGLTDSFPANLVATGGAVTITGAGCAGFAPTTIAASATSLTVTAGTLPAGGTCTLSFAVRSAIAGTYNNTTSGVTTTTTGGATGAPSNTASLGVGLINISKFFSPSQIQSGGTSTITYTLTNPTATLQTAGTFLDTMINMSINAAGAAGGTCAGANTNNFAAGATSLNFANLQIPASGSCTVTVVVTSTTIGTNPNAANGVSTALLTQGPGSNTDNLVVVGKPTIAKSFSPSSVPANSTSTMTFTLTNPNTIALTGINFTDTYPAGLTNNTPLTVGGTCTGVTHTAAAGGNTFNVTGGTIPANSSCTITVVVLATGAGVFNNSASGVASTQSGTAGAASNVATLTSANPATLTKAFGTSPIAQGGTSVITFTLTNPNATALTNLNFTDTLVNMSVSSTAIGGTCAGATNSPALVVGVASLNLNVPTLAGGASCTITVTVTSSTSGTHPNTTSGITSTQTPVAGPASNTANLVVLMPPTLTKSFSPAQIEAGGTSTITFTIANPQATALTNVTFSDVLANMTVASTTVGGTCAGETFSPALTVGGTQINPTVPTLGASASCTITVQVTSNVPSPAGGHVNTTGPISSTQTPTGGLAASGNLVVLAPPTVTKTFTPNVVSFNTRSTIIFTITNPNFVALNNISFTDDLTETPAALLNDDAQNFIGSGRGTCIGATPASKAAGHLDPVNFTGITLAAGSSCTIYMDVYRTANAGFYSNTVTNITSTETPTPTTGGTDVLTVNDRILLEKTFSVAQAQVGQVFRMRFTVSNPNSAGNNQNGIDLSDTFPAGLQVGNPPNITTNGACTPFATGGITAGATTLTLTNVMTDLDNLETCYVEFDVVATTPGVKVNTVTAPAGGNPADIAGSSDNATVEIFAAPSIAKAFSPATIGAGGTSTITFTLSSTNSTTVTNASFTDTLTNMSVSGNQTVGGTCVGTAPSALTNGATALSFSGISIPANGSCTVTLVVTSTTVGTLPNTASGVTTTQTPTAGANSGAVNLTVVGSQLTKAFLPTTIQRGTTSRLTFTIANGAGNPAQPLLAFTDTLPTNVVIATPANTLTTCNGGTVTAAPGGPTVSLSGANFTAGQASCIVAVDVTSNTTGTYNNVTANISGLSSGLGAGGVNATLTVQNNATLTKAFAPTSIGANGTSVLTFTITNGAGAGAYAGQGFTDNLPAGVQVAGTPGVVNTCGGTVTANAGATSIALANGSIGAAPATCTVSVNVTSANLGNYVNNSANIGGLTGGLTAAGVNATLQVVGTALTKAFSPTVIGRGGTSTMTFTIANGAGNPAQTGLGFIENLPANVFVASAPTVVNNCGGTVTAVAGAGTIQLAGGTLAAAQASCTFSVNVTSAFPGSYVNNQSRIANASSTMDTSGVNATLTVLENPAVSKAFTPSSMPVNGTSSLAITITNANNVAITGLQVTDVFPTSPAAMTLANLTTNNTCGGTLQDSSGGALNVGDVGVRVTGGTVAANSSCTITVNVTAGTAGSYVNTIAIGGAQSTNAGVNSTAATDTLNVLAPPTITKAYSPNPQVAGSNSTLTITITNPNSFAAITGATFTDTNPAGVLNQSVGATTCTGGSVVATVGGSTVQLLTGGVPASGSCTVTISQSAAAAGAYNNTIAIGDLTTTNAGSNAVAANATFNVYTAPTIGKAFGANVGPGGSTTLTFTLTNPAANPGVVSGISFVDVFPVAPAAMTLFDTTVNNTCAGTVTDSGGGALNAGDVGVQLTGVSLNAGASCTIAFNVTVPQTGSYNNTSAAIAATTPLALTGGTANATLTAVQPGLTKAFGGASIDDGVPTTLVFTLTNGAGNPAQSGLGWTETLPASLRFTGASLPVAYSAGCSGAATVTATGGPPLSQIVLSNIAMAAATASCTVTIGVNGTSGVANVAGQFNASCAVPPAAFTNNSANVTGETRVTDNVAGQCLVVNARPTLTKSFGANPQTIGVGQTATLTFTIDNTAASSTARSGLGFTDTLPGAGALTAVASTPQCGGGTVGVSGGNVITVSGASVAAGATCTITATVTGVTAGSYVNGPTNSSISGVTTNLNNGVTDQTLNVRQATLTKAFGGASIDDAVPTALVFTLTNGTGNPAQSGLGWTETLPAGLRFTGASLPVAYSAGCSGAATVTATGGPPLNQIVVSGVAMAAATANCTVTIGVNGTSGVANVTGQFNASCAGSPAAFTNTSANITGETRVTDGATPQCLVVNSKPTLTKSFGANPQTIGVGQTTTLTFTIDNTAAGSIARSALGFTDTLPGGGGLTAVASTPQCGGGTVGVSGGNVITVSGASVAAGATCTITATVTGATAGTYVNGPTNSSITGVTANLNNGVTDQTLHVRQPNLTKAFGNASIDDGVPTTLVFTLTNGAGNPAQSGLGWTETLPASLRFTGASLPVAYSAGCSGAATVTATGGPPLNQIVVSGIAMAAATSSCTVTIGVNGTSGVANVTGQFNASCAGSPAAFTNTSANITGETRVTDAATGQCLVVNSRPTLTKSFGANPQTIGVGQTATLTFTIDNTALGSIARSGLGFTDTLPGSGALTAVASTPQCGGGTVGVSGGNVIAVSGASVASGATCTITATVTGVTAGSYINGPTNSSISGVTANLNNGVTDQTLNVRQASLTKSFGAAAIDDNVPTALVFTLTNGAGNPAQSGLGWTETLPAGLRFTGASLPVAYSAGCSGAATVTATGGPPLNQIVVSGVAMAAATASCTVTIGVNGTSGVTNVTGQFNASCAGSPAAFTNTSANITGETRVTDSATAQCLVVNSLPTITKAFGAANIGIGQTTTLAFSIANTGGGAINRTGMTFSDALPAGLVVANPPVATTSAGCAAATLTGTADASATFGATGVNVNAGQTCVITVTVRGATLGAKANNNGNVTVTGMNNGVTTQTVTVVQPALTKAFGGASIDENVPTALVFTLTNGTGNPAQSGLGWTETLPASLRFTGASLPVAYSAGCSGAATVTATGGPPLNQIVLSSIAMADTTASCTVTIGVNGTSGVTNVAGQYNASCAVPPAAFTNNSANVTGETRVTDNVAGQCLVVNSLPTITKAFGAANIGIGQTTTLAFTINNTAGGNINRTGMTFSDALPAGLVVANPPVATTSAGCAAATLTGTADASTSFGATGVNVNAGQSCVITVTVRGATVGAKNNNTGNVTVTGMNNGVTTQTVTVVQADVAKTFGAAGINDAGSTTLVFTLTNGAGNPSQGGIALGDTLPSGLRFNSATPAVAYSAGCSGPPTATYTAGTRVLSGLTGIAMASSTVSCTVTVSGVTNEAGQIGTCPVAAQTNLAANVTTTNATNTSTNQCLSVSAISPNVAKTFGAASINDNATTTLVFTLTNQGTNPAQSGIALGDTLPSGLRFNTTTPAVAYSAGCSGPATAAYNTGTRILSGLTAIAMTNGTASCTVTVSGITNEAGQTGTCPVAAQTNLAANVTTTNATNISTNQCLSVAAISPNVAKTFGAASINDGSTTTMVFTLTNQGSNPAQSGIALGDTLPSGLRFNTTTPGVAYSAGCSGPASASYNTGSRVLSGLTGIAMTNGTASCTVTISGVANEAGQVGTCAVAAQTNLAANVTTTNANNISTDQCLTVNRINPNVAKTFGAGTITDGNTTTLVFTLTNQGTNPAQSGIALGDTLPSGLRFNTTTPAVAYGAGCSGPASASYNTGSRILSGLTGIAITNGTASCTVTISGVTNEPGQTGTCPVAAQTNLAANVTTTNATNISTNQCLTVNAVSPNVAKTFGAALINDGSATALVFTLTNQGTNPAQSGIALGDTLPSGLRFNTTTPAVAYSAGCSGPASASYNTGSRVLSGLTGIAMTNGTTTCTVTVSGVTNEPGQTGVCPVAAQTNLASNVTTTNATNVSTDQCLSIRSVDLAIAKSHTGNFTVGVNGVYTIVVSNAATSPTTSGTITVVDNLPSGLGFVSAVGTGWSCGAVGQVVTCTTASTLAGGASSNPITLTVSVAAGAQPSVLNIATVSGGNEPAANSGNNIASDNTLVGVAAVNQFLTNGAQTVLPGTNVFYPHTFIAGMSGSVTFSTTNITSPNNPAWTQAIYRDTDCNGTLNGTEGSALLTTPVVVVPGDQVCIIVRDSVPGGAPFNAQNQITVTATFNGTLTYTRNDITTVGSAGSAGLTLSKTVRNVTQGGVAGTSNQARPGDTLEYVITYSNLSSGPITNIVINDSTPSFTVNVSATCGALPLNLLAPCTITQPSAGASGAYQWAIPNGSLAPGQSGTVTFTVTVQN